MLASLYWTKPQQVLIMRTIRSFSTPFARNLKTALYVSSVSGSHVSLCLCFLCVSLQQQRFCSIASVTNHCPPYSHCYWLRPNSGARQRKSCWIRYSIQFASGLAMQKHSQPHNQTHIHKDTRSTFSHPLLSFSCECVCVCCLGLTV